MALIDMMMQSRIEIPNIVVLCDSCAVTKASCLNCEGFEIYRQGNMTSGDNGVPSQHDLLSMHVLLHFKPS